MILQTGFVLIAGCVLMGKPISYDERRKCRSLFDWIPRTRDDLSDRDRKYLEENFTANDYEKKILGDKK